MSSQSDDDKQTEASVVSNVNGTEATELDMHGQLNQETGVIAWSELVRFFARGIVIKVTPALDLVDVGFCMTSDNSQQMEEWLQKGLIARASDDDARDWTRREPDFWALVTAPWVLVQEKPPEAEKASADGEQMH